MSHNPNELHPQTGQIQPVVLLSLLKAANDHLRDIAHALTWRVADANRLEQKLDAITARLDGLATKEGLMDLNEAVAKLEAANQSLKDEVAKNSDTLAQLKDLAQQIKDNAANAEKVASLADEILGSVGSIETARSAADPDEGGAQ